MRSNLCCTVLGGKDAIVLVHRCQSPSGCIIGSNQAEHFLHFGKYRHGAWGCTIDLNLMGESGWLVHWTATVLPWLIIKQMFFSTAGWLALQAAMVERREREKEHTKGGERGGYREQTQLWLVAFSCEGKWMKNISHSCTAEFWQLLLRGSWIYEPLLRPSCRS